MTSNPSRREAGLTLIEVMVSVLLAAILTAGVFNMMIGQTRTYDSQLKATVKQENLWAAMEYLQRQIRMAGFGFGGCPNSTIEMFNGTTWESSTQSALRVFNDCSLYDVEKGGSAYPPASCSGHGVDSLVVQYASDQVSTSTMGTVTIEKQISGANLKATSCGDIVDNDYIALWDPSANPAVPCIMLQVTKDPGSEKKKCTIQVNPGKKGSVNNPTPAELKAKIGKDNYGPGSVVLRLGPTLTAPLRIAVDRSTNPPRLVQWRGANTANYEVIADGIEDMQISFACDRNGDRILLEGPDNADDWAYNVVGDAWNGGGVDLNGTTCGTTAPLRNISAVRITLVARSAGAEAGVKGRLQAIEDRGVGGADNFARAVLTATVKPRNIQRLP